MLESTIIVSQENFRQLEQQRDSKGTRRFDFLKREV